MSYKQIPWTEINSVASTMWLCWIKKSQINKDETELYNNFGQKFMVALTVYIDDDLH